MIQDDGDRSASVCLKCTNRNNQPAIAQPSIAKLEAEELRQSTDALSHVELLPFTIAIDTREQSPFAFSGFTTTEAKGSKPIGIKAIRKTLATGDYSIEGMEDKVTIERKSTADLFSTLTSGRARFIRELERMASLQYSAVVIESDFLEIGKPQPFTSTNPFAILRTIQSFSVKYSAHWFAMPGRRAAEEWTWQLLETFWRKNQP